MSQALTRRAVVTAAPAAIVAASLPALAGGSGVFAKSGENFLDAELLALREPYDRTMAGIDAASPAHSRAEDAFFAARQAHPDLDERALRKTSGLVLADRAWQRAVNANTVVIEKITEAPARTIEGLIFKARVAEADSFNLDLAASIVADLVAMGDRDA